MCNSIHCVFLQLILQDYKGLKKHQIHFTPNTKSILYLVIRVNEVVLFFFLFCLFIYFLPYVVNAILYCVSNLWIRIIYFAPNKLKSEI